MTLVSFWLAHLEELGRLTGQHIVLVLVSTGIAVAFGIPAGVLAVRRPRLGQPLLLLASVAQTIPSLALLGFLLPLPFIGGVGPRTALVALTLYALLPIVRTTAAGLRSIDPSVIESGVAMGMTSRQLLTMVELPLAVPSIVAGIRVAAVVGVGTATIADNFCNRWSGGLGFLDHAFEGSEVSIEPDGSVYPCCIKTKLPIGNLVHEHLIDILDALRGDPVYEAIHAGEPERMGEAFGWDVARFVAASRTRTPSGQPYENLCIGCDRFHEEVLLPRIAAAKERRR